MKSVEEWVAPEDVDWSEKDRKKMLLKATQIINENSRAVQSAVKNRISTIPRIS